MATPNWVVDTVGVAAGVCSMASFIPQIVKIVRERDAAGVSLCMYAVTIIGFGCWVTYGVLRSVWPVAVSNGVCLLLTLAIFVLRLKFGDNSPRQ